MSNVNKDINQLESRSPRLPTGRHVSREGTGSGDHGVETTRTRRRFRKKRNAGRVRNAVEDGFVTDDEDEDEQETRLPKHMSSNASISQQSGLTGFSGGIEFSPDANSDDQEFFTIGKEVDPGAMVDAFIYGKLLRRRYLRPPHRRQRRRCVSEQELGRTCYIGSSTGGQYRVSNRAKSFEGFVTLVDETAKATIFPGSSHSTEAIDKCNMWQVYPEIGMGEHEPLPTYFYPVVDNQKARAVSEPLHGETPCTSESFDGRHQSDHEQSRTQRKTRHSPEPKMERYKQRSSSVPNILIQGSSSQDENFSRGRTRYSVCCEEDFESVSRLNIPGCALRIVHPSSKASIVSFADELSKRDLRTKVLKRNATQSTGVVCSLTEDNLNVHNNDLHLSEDDSCYISGVGSQSQHSHITRAAHTQFQERSSSEGFPRTSDSCNCRSPSLFPKKISTSSRPTFVDGHRHEAFVDNFSSMESSHSLGELKLTVVRSQDQEEESQERPSTGRRVYLKLIKCVVVSVVFLIVLICILTLTSKEDY